MTYTIIIPKAVQKQLNALPDNLYNRIDEALQQLAETPRPDGVVKLKGSNNEYRIRVGDYRIRYEIDDEKITILLLSCRHRKDAYKKRS